MMKTLKYCLIVFLAILSTSVFSQKNPQPTIGSAIPDITVKNLINYNVPSEKLKVLTNGRHVIIDFFATWCMPCVEALPKLQRLQDEYKDRLLILSVTTQDKHIIDNFFKKRPQFGKSLIFAYNDAVLTPMFPHRTVPHSVWIDDKGNIKAIASGGYIDDNNINDFLNEKVLDFVEKKDRNLDMKKPLTENLLPTEADLILSRSTLTKRIPGAGARASFQYDNNGQIKGIRAVNLSPLSLLNLAYSMNRVGGLNRTRIFYRTDSAVLIAPKEQRLREEWSSTNLFSYELTTNIGLSDSVFYSRMFNDLNGYFNVRGVKEKKEIECYVLYRTQSDNRSWAAVGKGASSGASTGRMRNASLKSLTDYLNRYRNIEPVLDETGITSNVDMDLEFVGQTDLRVYPDIAIINKNLSRYGLTLKKEARTVDVLVIEDQFPNLK